MGLGYLRGVLIRMISSLLCAGVFYFAWMAAFLLVDQLGLARVEAVLWLLAPVITAAGFAVGMALLEGLTGTAKTKFVRLFVWPLMGCMIGAGVVYWIGPMLIVIGMFAAGTVSMVLREVVAFSGSKRA